MALIDYRIMTSEDGDQVRELFYTYWRSEPLAMALHMEIPRECKRYVDYALAEGLNNGISAVAVERKCGNIVGFIIGVITTRDNWNDWKYPVEEKDCEKLIAHGKISSRLYEGLDLFQMYGVDKMAEGIAMVIHPDYACQGISTKLFATAEWLFITKHRVSVIFGEATSRFSRRILEKSGFEIIREVKFDEYIADGTLDMPPNSPHKSMTLTVKRISPTSRL